MNKMGGHFSGLQRLGKPMKIGEGDSVLRIIWAVFGERGSEIFRAKRYLVDYLGLLP